MSLQIEQVLDRATIVAYVRRWGGSASDAALDPGCKIYCVPEIEGFISYKDGGGCVIAYGDPICAHQDLYSLTQSFNQYCDDNGKNIIYLTATKNLIDVAVKKDCQYYIEFGEELFIDPHDDPQKKQGDKASLVRRKVRHAIKEGAIVKEYVNGDPIIKQEMEKLSISWLESRRGPQIHTSNVFLFADQQGKRWWYAEQDNKIVGVAVLNQLQSHQGWLLNHVMALPNAPGGTPEMLIISVLDTLKQEGCHYVSFGAVPAKELGSIQGLSKASAWFARQVFLLSSKIFHLEERKKFWNKYFPQSQPSYLVLSNPRLGFSEIKALMKALNVTF